MDTFAAALASLLVSLGVVGAVAALFRALMASKDQQIEWLREDNLRKDAVIERLASTNERAVSVVEDVTPLRRGGRSGG